MARSKNEAPPRPTRRNATGEGLLSTSRKDEGVGVAGGPGLESVESESGPIVLFGARPASPALPGNAIPGAHPTLFASPYPTQIEGWSPQFAGELRGVYGDRWKPSWSAFGHPRGGNGHSGTDIFAPVGSALVAVVDGELEHKPDDGGEIGNRSWLSFFWAGERWRFVYGHLSGFSGASRSVQRGEVIGFSGCSGNADYDGRCSSDNRCGQRSSHCHLMLVREKDAAKVDPIAALGWPLRYADDRRDIPCEALQPRAAAPMGEVEAVGRLDPLYVRQRDLLEQMTMIKSLGDPPELDAWRRHLLAMLEEGSELLRVRNVDTAAPPAERVSVFWQLLESCVADLDGEASGGFRNNIMRFLLHVAWHEGAKLKARKQGGGGPARSFFQFEAPRAKESVLYARAKGWLGKLAVAGETTSDALVVAARQVNDTQPAFPAGNHLESLLVTTDLFGVWLARTAFKKLPEDVPASNDGHADYWYRHWKRTGGDPEQLKRVFRRGADEVDRLIPSVLAPPAVTPAFHDDIRRALAWRELSPSARRRLARKLELMSPAARATPRAISTRAFGLLLQHESGGHDYYVTVLGERPYWPGEQSGVTVGFGFDLGYQSKTELDAAWLPHLGEVGCGQLVKALGLTPGEGPDAAERKAMIRALVAGTARL
jgi:hypothetical protein